MQSYPSLQADILKIGHHGSKTSTSEHFLQQLHPKIAIIPVGVNNRYNHPHQEVVDRLQRMTVLRTDIHGMITYQFSRRQGTFITHLTYDRVINK